VSGIENIFVLFYNMDIKAENIIMRMRGNSGITLVELMVALTVFGVLVIALGFTYQGWQKGYRVESQMKTMYVDLMNARGRAMRSNRIHFVTLAATSYSLYEDTNPAPDGNRTLETAAPADDEILTTDVNPNYPIVWSGAADTQIAFTGRGISQDNKTICIMEESDYNCVKLSATRINLGKLTAIGGACDAANCVAR
jgi:prepilin-type N-terminal cleavage/methylation domain-containing protein